MAQRTLAHYQLEDLLGKGGMGEVYLATDTRLSRKVAVKILPQHLAGDSERRQRLEREARSISGLNHPHICTLHDVGHADGVDYLVMEYLEGETLGARIAKGPLSHDDFLATAIQITDGLNAAHRAGLVHRDLKPGNIMLTKAGAKLLDFGLARTAKDEGVSNLTAAPTLTSPLTAEGTLVGTFQYLAPELLEGAPADARSDLFALGIVLYEMATGRPAFEAKTQAGLIGAILERDPAPISSVVPNVAPALENLISACMAKDPEQRIQTAHDVLLQLRWIRDGGSAIGIPTAQVRHRKRVSRLAWGLVAVFAALSAVLAFLMLTREEPVPPRIQAVVEMGAGEYTVGTEGGLALSPDGTNLVYGAATDESDGWYLRLRPLGRNESRVLEETQNARAPFWSPDGKSIGFMESNPDRISRVDVVGGSRRTICEAPDPAGATWGAGDVVVAGSWNSGQGLLKAPASGGEAIAFVQPDTSLGAAIYIWPSFLPDGEHVLFSARYRDQRPPEIRLASLDGRVNKLLFQADSNAHYAQGHLLYVEENTLFAVPLDLGNFQIGEPFVVTAPVSYSNYWLRAAFAVSANGIVANYENMQSSAVRLVDYARDGSIQREVPFPTTATDLDISPDDRKLVVARPPGVGEAGQDVWAYDLVRDVFTRVSFESGSDDPTWSPDGREIVYAHRGKLVRKASSGVGEPVPLGTDHDDAVTHDWSLDGKYVIYCVADASNEDLWAFDMVGDRGAFPILQTKFREYQGQLSPDGKWLIYVSDESGERQVYALSWPDLGEKIQISRDGGLMPRWKRDGSEIFYLSVRSRLVSVGVEAVGNSLRVGQPVELFKTRMALGSRTHEFDVDSTGEHFFLLENLSEGDERETITVIANWMNP